MIRVSYRFIFPYINFIFIICNFVVWINIYRLNLYSYLLSWFATQVMVLKFCVIKDVIAIHRCIDFNISNDDSILILLKDFLRSWYKMYLMSYMVFFLNLKWKGMVISQTYSLNSVKHIDITWNIYTEQCIKSGFILDVII